MRLRGLLVASLFCLSCVSPVGGWWSCQSRQSKQHRLELRDLSGLLERQRKRHALPAVTALVIQGQQTVARGVAGVRKLGHSALAGLDDRWHLGSCTKALTATMIGILVQRGTLSWDSTISNLLPGLRATMRPEYRDVTLELLLAHRGAIRHEWDVPGLWPRLWKRTGTPVEQRARMTRAMLAQAPKVKPGSYFYSNCGYGIAGHMAEVATGKPWEQLMRELVFEPLGMKSAGFGVPWTGPPVTDPWPHKHDRAPITPGPLADNPPSIGPGGTIHASIQDWARFIGDHLRGARGEDGVLLKAATYRHLHRERAVHGQQYGYALGWKVLTRPWARGPGPGHTGRCLNHLGSNNSWFADVWLAPERDFAVLSVTNIGGPGMFARIDAVTSAVIQDHLGSSRPDM